jgi:serine-type D-Ala-D-Ala carboxypeptidase/endopeptidase (penicillin-binding protein 4)
MKQRWFITLSAVALLASHMTVPPVAAGTAHARHTQTVKRPTASAVSVAKAASKDAPIRFFDSGALVALPSATTTDIGNASNELQFASALRTILRTSLQPGVTSLLVADAKTGEAIFSLRPDDAMNPASNVKMISSATSLAIFGPDHQFITRLIGPAPTSDPHTVDGDVYLLGTWDPTLDTGGLRELAKSVKAQGVDRIAGNIVLGDADRDGPFGARIPLTITATKRGKAATAEFASWLSDTTLVNRVVTVRGGKTAISIAQRKIGDRYQVTIRGKIVVGDTAVKTFGAAQRANFAARWLAWELRQAGVAVDRDIAMATFEEFTAHLQTRNQTASDLAVRKSATVAELVTAIDKRSINWLADRLVAVAGGFAEHSPPSMALGVKAMYAWLQQRALIKPDDITIDTGSGLSYRTKISAQQLVTIIRSAGGFVDGNQAPFAQTWQQSLAIAGKDGTLAHRFAAPQFSNRIFAKTGTLSNVVALSGVLVVDPAHPMIFSLVTNKHQAYQKQRVRQAHEQVLSELVAYAAKRDGVAFIPALVAPSMPSTATDSINDGTDDEPAVPVTPKP